MVGTINTIGDFGPPVDAIQREAEARKKKGLSGDDAWYWHTYVSLPEVSLNPESYLLRDDIPNFLRMLLNYDAVIVDAEVGGAMERPRGELDGKGRCGCQLLSRDPEKTVGRGSNLPASAIRPSGKRPGNFQIR